MGALREPRFRRLLVGWSLSNFGDSALYLSLAIWAKDLTGSNAAAGLVFFALAVPVFLSPLGGYVADRVRRRPLLIGTNLVGAVMVLALLAVDDVEQLWILYAVAFSYGVLGTVIGSAQSGLLRDLLPDEDLATANAALSTIDQGLRILSPLVGAGIYAAYGGGSLAILASATFLAAVVALATVRIAESDPREHPRESFRREFTAGFRHVRATPQLFRLVVAVALAFAVIGTYDSIVFAVVEEGLGREPAFFGVLMSLQGGGSILGGITAAWLIRRLGEARTVGLAFLTFAVSSAGFAAPTLALVGPAAVVGGAAIPWLIVGFVTARQRLTPRRLQGRVSAVTLLSMNGPQTVSIAMGAVLISVVDYRLLIAVTSAVIAVSGLWLLRTAQAQPEAVLPSVAEEAPQPDRVSLG
ncbi:MAG: MFS transporter [Geodermatophilaceae bacterium]|nr:MFS transporter [Geodermatophilaceae bacterium]MDQ3456233.1 MFS transporter [Actinomycetota bacterium]